MTLRWKTWSIGLIATLGMMGASGWAFGSYRTAFLYWLIGLFLLVLIGESVAFLRIALTPDRPSTPPGALPADGVVDLVEMTGVEAVANPVLPRFRRFAGRIGEPGEPVRVGWLPNVQPPLLGKVVLISVFVGRDGQGWTDEEISRGHDSLKSVGLWIEREAIRHSAWVNVGLADTYFQLQDDQADEVEVAFADEGDDVGPMEAHASTKAVVAASRAAATQGFADVVDLLGQINSRVEADARVWLFHLRRRGRSLAIPARECEVDGVGLAVCYARESSFPEPLEGPARVDPSTVAHELLHLFGASDKYGTALGSFPTGTVSPRDIMRLNHDRLSSMRIDSFTASEVGWEPDVASNRLTKNARR